MSYRFAVCTVKQWKTPDDGQRNCPKHVDFNSKNKYEKLVDLVGFIIRIHHDARSPERQISVNSVTFFLHMVKYHAKKRTDRRIYCFLHS